MRQHFYIPFFIIVLIITLSFATAASAEDSMDKVPDEYIAEASAFYDECSADNHMNQYYNCECLSVAYLDERIKNGEFTNKSSIQLAISDQCRDAIGSAGPVYQSCLSHVNTFPPGTDPEKYCECVANTYVKALNTNKPIIDGRRLVAYKSMAYSVCSDPDAPKPDRMTSGK